ncbi:MAG: RDD family protein [Erysipelotrichaceae bacterium]|nr:RDD family protein [Erysipelotrichaceae bacterium]
MKKIFLAPKGKRMLARLIDFLIMLAVSATVYFAAVYPNVFDAKRFQQNSEEVVALYQDSGLFVTNKNGQYAAKSNFKSNITTIEKLSNVSINLDGTVVDNNNLLKDLYTYYTTDLNIKYGGQIKLTYETFTANILKVGTEESNISEFVIEEVEGITNYSLKMIDDSKMTTTLSFFLTAYENAAVTVDTSSVIKTRVDESNQMLINVLLLIIPVIAVTSFIFDGLVPFFSPYGQTIGKYIFHLIVLTDQGHRVKKIKQLLRWLIYFLELAFGIATLGGGILVPYTMFLFTKKRQALHDKVASTVVADGNRSIFFDSMKEEAYITNRLKEKGIDLDEPSDSSGTSSEE